MSSIATRLAQGAAVGSALILPALAWAAEGEEGGVGLPQLDPSKFATQLFWLVIILVAFFFALRNLALPRISDALEARRAKIDEDLERAESLRAEAEVAMAAYEKALAAAAAEAQKIQRETAQRIIEAEAEQRADYAGKLATETVAAEARIAGAKQPALDNIPDVAAETAQAIVARLADVTIAEADAKAAVDAAARKAGS